MTQFLKHKETGREFEIMSLDKAAGTIKLRGPNTPDGFTEPYDKERFKANGYELVTHDGGPKGQTPAPKPKPAPAPPPEPDAEDPADEGQENEDEDAFE